MALAALNNIPNFNTFASILGQAGGNGISADVFRESSQSQNTSQTSNSFAGAQTSNLHSATAEISQEATAENLKDATISAASGTGTGTSLTGPRHSGIILGGPIQGSAIGNFLQNQGGGQNSFGQLTDGQGNPSQAGNSLDLSEQLNAVLNSRSDTTVIAPTNLGSDQQPTVNFVLQGSDTNPRLDSLIGDEVEDEQPRRSIFGRLSLPVISGTPPLQPFSPATGFGLPTFNGGLSSPTSVTTPTTGRTALGLQPFTPPRGLGGEKGALDAFPDFTSNLLNVVT